MVRLSLALLGAPRITLGGQPVSGIAYNKARALLAYLAVEAERPHQRDTLVSLLWPDLPDTAARTNLREAIGDAGATPPFLLITRDYGAPRPPARPPPARVGWLEAAGGRPWPADRPALRAPGVVRLPYAVCRN